MEPGISAEDCLYADLGIDSGSHGCQHYDASQLLLFDTPLNNPAYLVLWQVGMAGDQSMKRFSTGPECRLVLVDVLHRDYPLEHKGCSSIAVGPCRLKNPGFGKSRLAKGP